MLKDLIKKNFHIIKDRNRNAEPFPFKLRGVLEIIGSKNGEIFHYDKQDNTVTVWAKHATMHLLTGQSFSSIGGATRSVTAGEHVGAGDTLKNVDGTMISGQQFFGAPTWPGTNGWWSLPSIGDTATHLYPFFPTKMLFGTGFEGDTWVNAGDSDYLAQYVSDGWTSTLFNNAAKEDSSNDYSATTEASGDTLNKTRSMNDIYSSTLTTPVILDTSFAVKGAIKDGQYRNSIGDSTKITLTGGNYFSTKAYWGTGYPAFIYARRESAWNESGTEIGLNYDDNAENKITYTITMPEQTGTNAGKFYPYNGFVLKEAGLFCDAGFVLKDTDPSLKAESDDSGLDEFGLYRTMPYGIMFAKRYIAPITKSHDVSITARWTIYL